MSTFAGRWVTSFGPIDLHESKGRVTGTYQYAGSEGRIDGELRDGRLVIRYQDRTGGGDAWFAPVGTGEFHGQYRLDGTDRWMPWNGNREWDGIWNTTFGRMRLYQDGDQVHGVYDGVTHGRIKGRIEGQRLTVRYAEPTVNGDARFDLNDDGYNFQGAWRPDGAPAWGEWTGGRVVARPGLTYLVVIEAHWQHSLADAEYSYGEMLKAFFARLPHVAVRHRYFNDDVSIEHWCREVMYCPEPAIVLISSHGTQDGITAQGHTINPGRIVDALRPATSVQLLHLAACLALKEDAPGDFARRIGKPAPFPISGYTTTIDWGGSAVLEFSYFDLILSKRLPPEEAARRLPKLVSYSGDEAPRESPYEAAGFRFVKP